MAASPPTQSLSAGGGAHIALYLDSDLGTHLGLSVPADSTTRDLKAQVAVEHAATFPDHGPVVVKSVQVLRKGAMYRLSDSMVVRNAFSKVMAPHSLHVNLAAAETDTHRYRDEDRGRSSDVLTPMPKEPSTRAVEVPKATGEELFHENQGESASDVEMTSRDKTKVIPPDMLLSSSQKNSGSQVTKHVQLGTDAQATSDLADDQSTIDLVHEGYGDLIVGDISISTYKVVAGEEKSAEGTNDLYHDETAVDARNMEKGSKREGLLETIDNTCQEKNCKQSKKVSSVEKATELVIVSTHEVSVHDPSNVKQGDSDVIKSPNGDGKRKRKKRRHLESSKDDLTQDVTKLSGLITNGSSIQNTCADPLNVEQTTIVTVREATVGDCRKVDETADVATTNVITEVLGDLRCIDNSSKVLNVDPLTKQTKRRATAALPPSAIQSDAPISSPSTKSKGKPVEILSTVLGPSHSSVCQSDDNAYTQLRESDSLGLSEIISDFKDVLNGNTAGPANGRTKSTKRQRNEVSLNHVCTDCGKSGKAIQSLGEQVRNVTAEDLKGDICNKAELYQGGLLIFSSCMRKIVTKMFITKRKLCS